MIHAAVGCYHLNLRNLRGARSQLQMAVEALTGYPDSHHTLDLESLRIALRDLLSMAGSAESQLGVLEGMNAPRIGTVR